MCTSASDLLDCLYGYLFVVEEISALFDTGSPVTVLNAKAAASLENVNA